MKRIIILLSSVVGLILIVFLFNYFSLQQPVNDVLAERSKENPVLIDVHYKYYINMGVLVFNIKEAEGFSRAELFLSFLQTAKTLQNKHFSKVELAFKGRSMFYVEGDYFNKTGVDYDHENMVYSMRTFPENLYNLNGQQPYPARDESLLSALPHEIGNFNEAFDKLLTGN